MGEIKLIKNAARCINCGEIIESKYTHDFRSCRCFKESKGETGIYVDGGLDYLHRGGSFKDIEELSEYEKID